MTRIFMLVLAAGICVVGFQLFGPGGAWFRAAELEEALALQNEANRVQQDRNEALGAELIRLSTAGTPLRSAPAGSSTW